jgi:hypothetical protein
MATINTLSDLCAMLGVEEKNITANRLSRRIYKDTNCGASISVQCMVDDMPVWFHNGDSTILDGKKLVGFTIQTIVEGVEATVDIAFMPVGTTTTGQVREWIKDMESEASRLWDEAISEEEEEEEQEEPVTLRGGTLQDRYSVYCQHSGDKPLLTFDQWLNK